MKMSFVLLRLSAGLAGVGFTGVKADSLSSDEVSVIAHYFDLNEGFRPIHRDLVVLCSDSSVPNWPVGSWDQHLRLSATKSDAGVKEAGEDFILKNKNSS